MSKKTKKNSNLRQLASIPLWLSGIALLTTLVLLAIRLVALVGVFTIPDMKVFNLSLWIAAGLVVVGLATFALIDPTRVRILITGRQARYGSNALITTVAFIGILVVLNMITFQNPKQWDLTEDKSNSLAPETMDILATLPTPVHATAFYSQNSQTASAQALLQKFATNSDGNFTYEFVDPDLNPLAAQQAGITGDAKIYLQMDGRHEIVAYATEQELVASLIRLMNPGERAVYFLTGHGEGSTDAGAEVSFSQVRLALEAKNYTVGTINLLAENRIPEDALAIILAGSSLPISTEEMSLLEAYLASGGSLVVLHEPSSLTEMAGKADPLAEYLGLAWGISFGDDIVIDPNSNQPLFAVANSYSAHPITSRLQGILSFFPTASSLFQDAPAGIQSTSLAITIDSAWGETDLTSMEAGQVIYDAGADVPGPILLAVAATNPNTGARLVVFGDSDFASDAFFDQYANGDMLINAIDWAAQQENLIDLTVNEPVERQLNMPSGPVQLILVLSLICLIPGAVVVAGVLAWIARKARG